MRGLQLRVEIADASVREPFRLDVDGVCVSQAEPSPFHSTIVLLSHTIPEPAVEYKDTSWIQHQDQVSHGFE